MNRDRINGFGAILRFITPILITIMLFVLNGMKEDMKQIRAETKDNFSKIDIQLTNHLSQHRIFDKEMIERLTRIETKVK